MSVNGITGGVASDYVASAKSATSTKADVADKAAASKAGESGVVYEPSKQAKESDTSKTSDYSATIKKMKLEMASKNKQLEDLVSQMLGQQAKKFTSLSEMFKNMEVDPETAAQAQKDIDEDGYWGVEKTSDRMVEMAKALSGGDSSKADELIEAIKKGYDQATQAWGDKLPDITQKTIDAATEKLTQWRDGLDTVQG